MCPMLLLNIILLYIIFNIFIFNIFIFNNNIGHFSNVIELSKTTEQKTIKNKYGTSSYR